MYQQPSYSEVNIPLTFYRYDGSCSSLLGLETKRYHYSLDKDIPLVYDSNLQPNDDCFLTISHKVTRQGPFSVIIFPTEHSEVPFTNIKLWYSENSELGVIDTLPLTQLCSYL